MPRGGGIAYTGEVHQIVFNEISAAELSAIPTLEQLELVSAFKVDENCLKDKPSDKRFGVVERDGRKIYRFRSKDYRIYFTLEEDGTVVVQRLLHADSLNDFLFRSGIGKGSEDQKLGASRSFWKLIDDGEHANRK